MGFTSGIASAGIALLTPILADAPAPLPEGPALAKWVLEKPLPLTAFLVIAALVSWYSLRGQGKLREAKRIAFALALLAGAVYAAGTLIQTERERLMARAGELVDAVAQVQTARVGSMLADDVVAQPFGFPRAVIMSKLETYLTGEYRVREHRVLAVRVAIDGMGLARTQMHVRVTPEGTMYNVPVGSWWLLNWRKDSRTGAWRVTQIQMQQLDGVGDVNGLRP